MKIVLLGYMGSGKTTVGRIVANHLNIKFLDLDAYIEEAERMSVSSIFNEKGEIYFRKKEMEYLSEIFLIENSFVLSLGGGTPCFGTNMELINEKTKNSFYLNIGIPELVTRLMKEKNHRPMISHLQDQELTEFVGKHLFERSFFYNKAHHKIKCNNNSPTEIAEIIINSLV
ncbi:shikimate kinase [Maribacter hydrothermalis]|uniref:Shikimate kinase n=1 Tax=Maribacter hydrothermalis TaxID=1836467 RepID=A0A1B7Z2H9_9FLAO|nr:shikimate kinase [Maribacter hydrothermalis]APQ19363.1 shikimate kinase [Maribacter hydrothermalis]OBR36760.1 shikimate kinase [Maribacter hydrothermalis]